MIRNESLAGWGEQAARSIPITGAISARRTERRLREAMGRVSDRSRDEKAPAWYADNEYLARREGSLALQAFHNAGRLRWGPDGAALVMLCRQLVQAGPITEERMEEFLTGARRTDVLPENEAALVGAALRMAVIQELGREDMDGSGAGELFTSLRTLSELDLTHALERSDPVDALLRQDEVYPKMDEESRAMYRARCQKLAKKHGVSAVREAQTALDGGLHDYLFPQTKRTGAGYIAAQALLTVGLSLLAGAASGWIWTAALVLLPVSELVRSLMDGALLRVVKPRRLPRLALEEGLGREGRTVCTVSLLLADSETGLALAKRLEEYRLASRDCGKELLFAILADLPDGREYPGPGGAERLEELRAVIDGLNETYGGGFFLLTRRPVWDEREKVFTPWERKRGAVMELARLVRGRASSLQCLAGDGKELFAEYILCLDGDTRLVPGAARALIGAAMHPLNRPVVEKGTVVRGHGVLHPRMSVELDKALATDFARIWAGQGGTDPYGAPTGELFTDLFDRGGFSGKGVVDAEAYLQCLENRFGDGRVLSHDALEGAYLRGAYVGDVELTDGAPVTAGAWFRRMHRWVRGDWQNLPWLFRAGRELTALDKWRLLDSMRRSLVAPGALACFLCAFFLSGALPAGITALICLGAEAVRDAFAGLFSRTGDVRLRCRSGVLRGLGGSLTRLMARLIFLPWEAYTCVSAVITALWRMGVSHRHMLQWVPAAQTEGLGRQPAAMWFSVAGGLALMLLAPGPAGKASGVVWLCAPAFACLTGQPRMPRNDLTEADRAFLQNSAQAIWGYFARYCSREDH
ncbi:MAG: hypothetical protein LUE21_12170 [Oscillospiraceae bacterium]|nr:hypothetical protein [Oscillospiraceae bacterium]